MAHAKVTIQYPDETCIVVEVAAENEHPDVLDELVTRVVRLYRDAVPDSADETEGRE